jgi:V8-like Glu-specific endopeptidase
MKLRSVAASIIGVAAVVASGCSSTPSAGHQYFPSGPNSYWTRSRMLGARPLRGLGFREVPLPGQSANAHPARLALRVGALFVRGGVDGNHFCTASVVDSPDRDLLITAAHCIDGGKTGGFRHSVVFIPDYRNGQAPFGVWDVARLVVAPQWVSDSDPNLDVGFVVLRPRDGKNIEDILGASRLGLDTGYDYLARVTGYPDSAGAPVTCINRTSRQSATQLRFECGGFTGGTSGSPWVTHFDPLTRTGTIIGVIGGYQQGGETPAISYSAYFGDAVHRLYREAIQDESAAGG